MSEAELDIAKIKLEVLQKEQQDLQRQLDYTICTLGGKVPLQTPQQSPPQRS
jgi:hypothetical protein